MVAVVEIVIILICVAIVAIAYKAKIKKRKDKDKVDEFVESVKVADLPMGKWFYIDEGFANSNNSTQVDTNGSGDLIASLALNVAVRGTLPEFIGVTCGKNGVDKRATVEAIKALAVNVPVLEGHRHYSSGDSELSRKIIEVTKKGKYDCVLGSPAGDLDHAFRNGAHHWNVTLYALLRGTWNAGTSQLMPAFQTSAMKKSANSVAGILKGRIFEIVAPNYYHLLYKNNLPMTFRDTQAFINRNRDLKAWDLAFTKAISKENATMNKHQGLTTGALRLADVLATAKMLGIEKEDTKYIFDKIQEGLDIFKQRITDGAVNTIEQSVPFKAGLEPEKESEGTRTQKTSGNVPFDINKVKWLHGSGVKNWSETSVLKSVSVTSNRLILRNSKGGIWPAVKAHGVLVDSNVWCFVEVGGIWYAATFEYLRPRQGEKFIGFNEIPSHTKANPIKGFKLKKGDTIHVMVSGLARSPQFKNVKERSNIVKVKLR